MGSALHEPARNRGRASVRYRAMAEGSSAEMSALCQKRTFCTSLIDAVHADETGKTFLASFKAIAKPKEKKT